MATRTYRVLMVDDDPAAVESYAQGLRLRGCHADCISGSALAQCKAKTETYDVIVLDMWMPEEQHAQEDGPQGAFFTGLRLYRDIRRSGVQGPVIVLSNFIDTVPPLFAEEDPLVAFRDKCDTRPSDLFALIVHLCERGDSAVESDNGDK